ncbi:PhzF family phenazine biosynthesis protein [uncultured Maribacter sp.]|uniref:PhzF family phenazine biosynthesis protein n=1 Tax=uncultured Maribacter sp. TaxID=431308 RepID=UPI00260E1735|nr:PhzF family phenazine biosynthesis protein [uncultured Maribacter sp.]
MKTYIVNSFTNEPFKGNPAGVCITTEELEADIMLSIAKELGHSETTFVFQQNENEFLIRFFSPKMEIPLCGHASLAASKVIFEQNQSLNIIQFTNIQNLKLKIEKNDDNTIQMEFPKYATIPFTVSNNLLSALGIKEVINCVYNEETKIMLLHIKDCIVLQNLTPNFEALYKSHDSINGVLVTALSNKSDFDFESRYFWPWSGTNEDPVTGATHTFLAPYWGAILGKTKMKSFQCSKRTGFLEVNLLAEDKMSIKGCAKIILEGKLKL